MPLYLYQAAYTAESAAAQIKEPQDRLEAVRPFFESMGAKILAGGYPLGEYDVLAVYEAPDDTTAAALALAIAAGGATRSAKTTRLLTGAEYIESLRKAQGSQYKPAR
ncbi:MAG TPA: GYD domain-containing protein [Streptosporangiaceae bacterium]|nr:GYD domain-containing protein [Streptosporangiaceae bacterium]